MQRRTQSTLIYAPFGLLMGVFSALNGKIIILSGATLFIILNYFVKKRFKGKNKSWHVTNGLWPYVTTWFAMWVFLFNL